MGFKLNGSVDDSGSMFPKGVYVDEITVTKADCLESQYSDVSLFVEATASRAKYPKKFYLSGNHLKEQGKPVDWGGPKNNVKNGSWKIAGFLRALGVKENDSMIDDNGFLTEETLRDMIGRKCFALQYDSNGKFSRETWFHFTSSEDGNDTALLEKWKSQKTFPDKYKWQSSNKALNNLWNEVKPPEQKEDSLPI